MYSFHVILTLLLFANGSLTTQLVNTRFSTTTSPIKKEKQKIMDLCNPKRAKQWSDILRSGICETCLQPECTSLLIHFHCLTNRHTKMPPCYLDDVHDSPIICSEVSYIYLVSNELSFQHSCFYYPPHSNLLSNLDCSPRRSNL